VSKNRRTAAAKVTTEINIHLEHPSTTVYITLPSFVCLLVTKRAITLEYKQVQNTANKETNMADVTRVVGSVSLSKSWKPPKTEASCRAWAIFLAQALNCDHDQSDSFYWR